MKQGEWIPCGNYLAGDIVTKIGKIYRAVAQSAGKDPENNPTYWVYEGLFPAMVPTHNSLDGLQGTSETDYFHVSENEAAALLYADEPSAANPVLTKKNLPALGKSIKDFETLSMPPGMGIIFGAYFDETAQKLIVVGDDAMASLDPVTRTWTTHSVPAGHWRDITKFGGNYIVVGKDVAMAGPLDTMALVPIPAGNWRSVAAGDSRVVAVAEGRVASSSNGLSGWGGKDTATGYGDSVTYSSKEGKFFAAGAAGCKSTPDNAPWGDAWATENIPAGTWRAINAVGDYVIAVSGTQAHKKWDETTWVSRNMPVGGWEDVAVGAGFVLTVGNGIAASAQIPALQYTVKNIPNNIYTCTVYGASSFWVLGSVVLTALTVDTAGALEAANGLNASNPPATMNELTELEQTLQAEIDELMELVAWERVE
jgi:hypothetical protein